ncbi:uncharacterized protein LOC106463904 isoform X2 [Limulus polyphemus]|uniref:Uncharacterized protein LOC106463904 isoform X2 n=1 Tax=Limulus polyphemus TaxID=6850 RepID=A0ABM1SUE4_LIMPO|nr:uncharacterized protein LOC106463904 isoform X2 [Limulus polyphemus]
MVFTQLQSCKNKGVEEKVLLLVVLWRSLAASAQSLDGISNVFHVLYKETALVISSKQWADVNPELIQQILEVIKDCSPSIAKVVDEAGQLCEMLSIAIQDSWGMTLLQEMLKRDCDSNKIGPPPLDMLLKRIECLIARNQDDVALQLCQLCKNTTNQNMFNSMDSLNETISGGSRENDPLQKDQEMRVAIFNWHLLLLHRMGRVSELVRETAHCSCHQGVHLIRQARESCESDAISLAETLTHTFLVRDLVVPSNYCCTKDLMSLWCSLQVEQNRDIDEVCAAAQLLLVEYASTSAHFYLFVDVLWEEYGQLMLPLYLEFYVRGLTVDLNFLEEARYEGAADRILELEAHVANIYSKLGTLFEKKQDEISLECILSAFSIDPTWERLNLLQEVMQRIATRATKSQCDGSIVSEAFLEGLLARVQDVVISNDESVKNDCMCGGRCSTPSEEPEVLAHLCRDGRPQYVYRLPHPVLDVHIQGVPYSLLKDFVMVLECMRCQLLKRGNSCEEMKQVCEEYLATTSALKTIMQHSHTYESADSETDSASEEEINGKYAGTMQQNTICNKHNNSTNLPLSTINNENSKELAISSNSVDYKLSLPVKKGIKKLRKAKKDLKEGSVKKLKTLKKAHIKRDKAEVDHELKKKKRKKKRKTKKEKDRDGSGETGLEKVRCKKRKFKKKDKVRSQILECAASLGLTPSSNSLEIDLSSLINQCVDILLSRLDSNATVVEKNHMLPSVSGGLSCEKNSKIALISQLLSSGSVEDSEAERIAQQLLQIEKKKRKIERNQKVKKLKFFESVHKQKTVENKNTRFKKVKYRKQGKKMGKKMIKSNTKACLHEKSDLSGSPTSSNKKKDISEINTKRAITLFTPTPSRQTFAPSDPKKKSLILSPARKSSKIEEKLAHGRPLEAQFSLNQPILCSKLRDCIFFGGMAGSKDSVSTVTTTVCKTRPSTTPILPNTVRPDSTIVSASRSCISSSISTSSTTEVPVIVSNKDTIQKPPSTLTVSPVLNIRTMNKVLPSHELESQTDATISVSVSAAEKLNISHQHLEEISQHVPAVATLTLPGWRGSGGGQNGGGRVLTGRLVIPVNNMSNNNVITKENFLMQHPTVMSAGSGNPATVAIPSVIIVRGAPPKPENKVSTKENLCQNVDFQKGQKKKRIWTPVRNRPGSLEYRKVPGQRKFSVGSNQKITNMGSKSRMTFTGVPVCIQAVNGGLASTSIASGSSQVVSSLVRVENNQKIMSLVSTPGVTIASVPVCIQGGGGNLVSTSIAAGQSHVVGSVSGTKTTQNTVSQTSCLHAKETSQSSSSNQYIAVRTTGNSTSVFLPSVTVVTTTTTTTTTSLKTTGMGTQTLTTAFTATASGSDRTLKTGVNSLFPPNSPVLIGLPGLAQPVASGQAQLQHGSQSLSFVAVQTVSVPNKAKKPTPSRKLKPKKEMGKHPESTSKSKPQSKTSQVPSESSLGSRYSVDSVKRSDSQFLPSHYSQRSVNTQFSAASVSGIQSAGVSGKCMPQLKVPAASNKACQQNKTEASSRSLSSISDAVRVSLMMMDENSGGSDGQIVQNYTQYNMNYADKEVIPLTSSSTFPGSLVIHPPTPCVVEDPPLSFVTSASNVDSQKFELPTQSLSLYSNASWVPEDAEIKPQAKSQRKKSLCAENQSGESKKKRKKVTSSSNTGSDGKSPEELKKFWCLSCSRSFFSAYNLRRHQKNVHKVDLPSPQGSGLETPVSPDSVAMDVPFVSQSQSQIRSEMSTVHQRTSVPLTGEGNQNPSHLRPENIHYQSSNIIHTQPVVTQVQGSFQYLNNQKFLPTNPSFVGQPGVYPVPLSTIHRDVNPQFVSPIMQSQAQVNTNQYCINDPVGLPTSTISQSILPADSEPLVTKEYSSLQPLPPCDTDFSDVNQMLHSTEKWEPLQPVSVSLTSEMGILLSPPEIPVSYGAPQVLGCSDLGGGSLMSQDLPAVVTSVVTENVCNSSSYCMKNESASSNVFSKQSQGGNSEGTTLSFTVKPMKKVQESNTVRSELSDSILCVSDCRQNIFLDNQKSFVDNTRESLGGQKLEEREITSSDCQKNFAGNEENVTLDNCKSLDHGQAAVSVSNQVIDNFEVVTSNSEKVIDNDNSIKQQVTNIVEDIAWDSLRDLNTNKKDIHSSQKKVNEERDGRSLKIPLKQQESEEDKESCTGLKGCSPKHISYGMDEHLGSHSSPRSIAKSTRARRRVQRCRNQDTFSELGHSVSSSSGLTKVLQPDIKLLRYNSNENVVANETSSKMVESFPEESYVLKNVHLKDKKQGEKFSLSSLNRITCDKPQSNKTAPGHEISESAKDTNSGSDEKKIDKIEQNLLKCRSQETMINDDPCDLRREAVKDTSQTGSVLSQMKSILRSRSQEDVLCYEKSFTSVEDLEHNTSVLRDTDDDPLTEDTVSNSQQDKAVGTYCEKHLPKHKREISMIGPCFSNPSVMLSKDILLEKSILRHNVQEIVIKDDSSSCPTRSLIKDSKFQRNVPRWRSLENVSDTGLRKRVANSTQPQRRLLRKKIQETVDSIFEIPQDKLSTEKDEVEDSQLTSYRMIIKKEDCDISKTSITKETDPAKQSSPENYTAISSNSSIFGNSEKIPETEDMSRPNSRASRWSIRCLQPSGRSTESNLSCKEEANQSDKNEEKCKPLEDGIRGRTRSRDTSKRALRRSCPCCENSTRSSFSKRCRTTVSNGGSQTRNSKRMLSKNTLQRKTRSSVQSGVSTRSSRPKTRSLAYS